MASVPIDDNTIKGLLALDDTTSDGIPVKAKTSTGALYVHLDSSDVSIGGGTQYTEGDTDSTITGTAMLWEDTGNTLKTVNASDPLPVAIISGAGSGGTASTDDADFTAGTTSGTPAMGVYESSPTSVTDGDIGMVGINQTRALRVDATSEGDIPVTLDSEAVVLGAGSAAIGKLAANSGVDIGDVDVTSISAGTNVIGKVRLVTATGDEITEDTDDSIKVTLVADDVGIGGGTEATDDTTTHSTGSTKGKLIMAAATPTDGSVDANDIGAVAMSTDRRLHVDAQIVGQDADVTIADGGNAITVDGSLTSAGNVTNAGTFAVQEDGDALTALQLIDDAVHTDDAAFTLGTSKGVMMMGFAGTQSVNANDAGAIAMDTDGAIHIADGGNTITVDGTVTANLSATDNGVLDQIELNTDDLLTTTDFNAAFGTAGSADSQVLSVQGVASMTPVVVDLGSNNDVTIDNSSIVHAEDSQHSSTDAGIMPLAVRNDTLAALAGTDGDYAPLQVNATGALFIDVADGGTLETLVDGIETVLGTIDSDTSSLAGAVSGSEMQVDIVSDGAGLLTTSAHDAAFGTAGSADTQVRSVQGIASMTPLLVDATGQGDVPITLDSEAIVLATGSNTVGEVTIGAATTAAGDLAKAEDAVHSSGDVGVMSLGVRDTSPAATSGTDGDYEPYHVNDDGGMWVTPTPSHQGGNSFFSSIDLDESEEQVSATACTVSYMYFWNATAAPLWVQIFNATAASIAPGSDAPDMNFPIPANADSDVAGITIPIPNGGIQFTTALSVAVTTGSGTNSGAPGANEAGGIIIYKN